MPFSHILPFAIFTAGVVSNLEDVRLVAVAQVGANLIPRQISVPTCAVSRLLPARLPQIQWQY
jgi:hypothetical protein